MTKAQKIQEIAARLGVPATWLDALINFETGGTYDVFARNPHSGAMGLIQVTNSTARSEFGVADTAVLSNTFSTFESYMDNVVYPYLSKYAPFQSRQEFYMSVFYPKYMDAAPDTEFPEYVKNANPGINTVQDYMNFVDRRIRSDTLQIPKFIPVALALGATGVIVYFYLKGN